MLISMAASMNNIPECSQSSYATENFGVCQSKDPGAICLCRKHTATYQRGGMPGINTAIYPTEGK